VEWGGGKGPVLSLGPRRTAIGSALRWAIASGALPILAGCAPDAPLPALGAHAHHAPRDLAPAATASAQAPASPEPPPPPWDLARELLSLRKVTERAASDHLAGEVDGEVLANDAARPYPALGPKHRLEAGATLLERHLVHGSDKLAVYFAMVKRPAGYDPPGGDWEYLVVTPDGHVDQRGRLTLCARCHVDAPHDHLFGGGR
jgi:hypothetical protein